MKRRTPSATSLIRGVNSRTGWVACLLHLERELARATADRRELSTELRWAAYSLQEGINEAHLAAMFAWWQDWDIDLLLERQRRGQSPKPRIELNVAINRRGNLGLTWRPAGANHVALTLDPESGWRQWMRARPRGQRPSDELIYVRDVRLATEYLEIAPGRNPARSDLQRDLRTIASILLRATEALIEHLYLRLSPQFEIEWRSRIVSAWKENESPQSIDDWWAHDLVSWIIEEPAVLRLREELAEIDRFETETGCALQVLADALRPSGKSASDVASDEAAAQMLHSCGFQVDVGKVRRMSALLARHRLDLVPWASNVVQLKNR